MVSPVAARYGDLSTLTASDKPRSIRPAGDDLRRRVTT